MRWEDGVRVISDLDAHVKKNPHPSPLPEYRERGR
jgi:hypothetical protein